jgi:hypothetical protein
VPGTQQRSQSWTLTATGNWSTLITNGEQQDRSHNQQNQVTVVTGAVNPVPLYAANGNLTLDESNKEFIYDAWNGVVAVRQGQGGATGL